MGGDIALLRAVSAMCRSNDSFFSYLHVSPPHKARKTSRESVPGGARNGLLTHSPARGDIIDAVEAVVVYVVSRR